MLYLVPTPIGNLQDITLRAIETLKNVDLILAEDTRDSAKLLKHYDIRTHMKSFHAHNEHKVLDQLIGQLKEGQNIALITDAGTPGISDPGFLLVRACHKNEIPISALPGATAFVPALVASGLPCDRFYFEGFLPVKKGRKTKLEWLALLNTTIVLYESPYRVVKTLKDISVYFKPDTMVSISRELTKIHEEVLTAPILDMLSEFEGRKSIKGEFVIIISGKF